MGPLIPTSISGRVKGVCSFDHHELLWDRAWEEVSVSWTGH